MTKQRLRRILTRSWFYFRVGHGTYLIFALSFTQWVVILYTLYVTQFLKFLFPTLGIFIMGFLGIYIPLAVLVGYTHYKRSPMFKSEVEIGLESNPFVYKLVPGKETILQPYHILGAKLMLRLYKRFKLLSPEEEETWNQYVRLLEHLAKGGDVRSFEGEVNQNGPK